jgi:hypothetical protein
MDSVLTSKMLWQEVCCIGASRTSDEDDSLVGRHDWSYRSSQDIDVE